jgi:hypothetical protein
MAISASSRAAAARSRARAYVRRRAGRAAPPRRAAHRQTFYWRRHLDGMRALEIDR